jgi:hypothetical protein
MTLNSHYPNFDIDIDMKFELQMEDKRDIDDTSVVLKYLDCQALLLRERSGLHEKL